MWRLVLCTVAVLGIISSGKAFANVVVKEIVAAVVIDVAADKFGEAIDQVSEKGTEAVISLYTTQAVTSEYGKIFSSADFKEGTGLLFELTVFESQESDRRYLMPPTLVGAGTSAEDVGLRAALGQKTVKHETYGADMLYLKDYKEISSLPESMKVSEKSRLLWVFKKGENQLSFFVIEDTFQFNADIKAKRKKLLLQQSVISFLPQVEALKAKSDQYADLSELYREQLHNAGVTGQLAALRAARSKAAGDLADAMQKLNDAAAISRKLKSIQVIQDVLSVAAIVNNASTSISNSAQMEAMQQEVGSLKSTMAELKQTTANIQAQMDYLKVAQQNLSLQLGSIELEMNKLFLEVLKIQDVLPEPQEEIIP